MKYLIVSVSFIVFYNSALLCQAQQWTPDSFCPFPSNHVTRYPKYGNCSVYWECYEGTKYIMECPEGLEFNAPLQQCDSPEIANCGPLASTTENPNPPTWTTISTPSRPPGLDCPAGSSDIIYHPYDGDCNKYWECYEGNAYLYTCPPDLWWHQELSQCDYPGDFCHNSTGPTEATTRTSELTVSDVTWTSTPQQNLTTPKTQPDCDGIGDDDAFYPYPGDCTKYWECANGNLYLYDCPDGLWWNQQSTKCDYPGDFCDNSTSTTATLVPNTTPSTQCEPEGTSYYPNYEDCHKFIICRNGVAFDAECPTDLYYDESTMKCVEENLSDCCKTQGCT